MYQSSKKGSFLKIEEINGFIVVQPEGKLDTVSAPEFSKELTQILETKPKGCVIDLSQVSFLSSSGLQALLLGAKISKKEQIRYAVCCMNEMVKDVFILSGFDRFIQTFDDRSGALAE